MPVEVTPGLFVRAHALPQALRGTVHQTLSQGYGSSNLAYRCQKTKNKKQKKNKNQNQNQKQKIKPKPKQNKTNKNKTTIISSTGALQSGTWESTLLAPDPDLSAPELR